MQIAQHGTDTSVSFGTSVRSTCSTVQLHLPAVALAGCIHHRQMHWHCGLAGARNSNMSDSLPTNRVIDFVESCVGTLLAHLLQDLCRKSIKHNASSGKAWERLGSILEREQAYKVEPYNCMCLLALDGRCLCWLPPGNNRLHNSMHV